ncbi:MAG: hypothetical protein ACYTG1_06000 [Planctomycetota bacterium]
MRLIVVAAAGWGLLAAVSLVKLDRNAAAEAGPEAGVAACPGDLVNCGGACVDPATDPSHCGACGNVCPAGTTCVAGACVAP